MATVYPKPCRTDTVDGRATAAAEGVFAATGQASIAGGVVRVAFDAGRLTSDFGALLLADIERRSGAPSAWPDARPTRAPRSGCGHPAPPVSPTPVDSPG